MRKIYCIAFVTLSSIVSCTSVPDSSSSSSINESSYFSTVLNLYGVNEIKWSEILKQTPPMYYAYVYSPTCYYCNLVKDKVNLLANCRDFELFFIKFDNSIPVRDNYLNTIGCNDVDKLYVVGTPTLFAIKDSSIIDCYLGYKSVDKYISNLLDID